jgi:hypothetical protein
MKIYVAHTYGRRHGLTQTECEDNALKAIALGREVLRKGHNPFVPNLWHWFVDWDGDFPDEETTFILVSDWIRDCDALLVGESPQWEGSGVHREMKIAEALGKKVYYSLDEVP